MNLVVSALFRSATVQLLSLVVVWYGDRTKEDIVLDLTLNSHVVVS